MAKGKGYQPSKRESRKRGHISFEEGHEFYGAEIDVWLTASIDLYLELLEMGNELSGAVEVEQLQTVFAPLIRRFAKSCLIGWNIDDELGAPTPADGDGLLAQEAEFITAILSAWLAEVGNPSAPLLQTSPDLSMSAAG